MKGTFLAVDKTYLRSGLKSIDILLFAQIEEFQRNGSRCYMTTEQFSMLFGESERTVERSLERLDRGNWIIRKSSFVSGRGRGNRQRILMLAPDEDKTETPNNGVAICQKNLMEATEIYDGSAKEYLWKRHNGGIKENETKENPKENLKENGQYIDGILEEMFETEGEFEPPKMSDRESGYEIFGGILNRRRSLEEIENAYLEEEE